jgi:hypothetical protein
LFTSSNYYTTLLQGGDDISPENEEVYEKASDAETAEEIEAGDADDEAEDVETKELLRKGEAEAPNRTACLRRRRPAPMAAEAEGRSAGSAARSDSMRQVEAEIAVEGEVEAKAAMEEGERAEECGLGWVARPLGYEADNVWILQLIWLRRVGQQYMGLIYRHSPWIRIWLYPDFEVDTQKICILKKTQKVCPYFDTFIM